MLSHGNLTRFYSRLHSRLALLAAVAYTVLTCNAVSYIRVHNSGGGTLTFYITKNGANFFSTGVGAASVWDASFGEPNAGDVFAVFTGSYSGTPVYRDSGTLTYTAPSGSLTGKIFPQWGSDGVGGDEWDSSASAPPINYCIDVVVSNDTAGPVEYIVGYNHPTTGAYVPVTFILIAGQTHTVPIGPLPAKVAVGVAEEPLGGVAYSGSGVYTSGSMMSFTQIASATAGAWGTCGGTEGDQAIRHNRGMIPNADGTNGAINFAATNSSVNPTNLLTEKSGQIGFNALAALLQAQNAGARDSAQAISESLDGLSTAIGGMTNQSGALNGALIGALTNGLNTLNAGVTNGANNGNGTNLAVLKDISTNTFRSLTNLARLQQIMEGGGVSNSVIDEWIATAHTGQSNENTRSFILDGDIAIQDGEAAIATIPTYNGADVDPDVFKFKIFRTFGGDPLEVDMDPRKVPLLNGLAEWFRLFWEASITILFFYWCWRKAQEYLFQMVQGSNRKALSGGVITEVGNRTLGYVITASVMATLASLPGFATVYLTNKGGWSMAFGLVDNLALPSAGAVGATVASGMGLIAWLLPVQLIITNFIAGILYDLAIAKVAWLALVFIRVLMVWAVAACLNLTTPAAFAGEVWVENWSGNNATNSEGTNHFVYPVGKVRVNLVDGAQDWSWSGGTVTHVISDGDTIAFSESQTYLVAGRSALNAFGWGFGMMSTIWLTGSSIQLFRSASRQSLGA